MPDPTSKRPGEHDPEERDEARIRKIHLSRRRFFQVTGVAACAAAAGGAAALSVDFLKPRVLFEPPTEFTLGPPDAIDVGAVVTNEVYRAYVIRQKEGFHALSSVCTHLGCITRYKVDENVIACPCHGSRYSLDGDVIGGPAPRPLPWFQIDLDSKGDIEVDTGVEVPEGTVVKL
ncbi:MAG: ubiquinol-cytochrome c reductase iron-sulfur subunit [Thermoanaerobaculia bacterium]